MLNHCGEKVQVNRYTWDKLFAASRENNSGRLCKRLRIFFYKPQNILLGCMDLVNTWKKSVLPFVLKYTYNMLL